MPFLTKAKITESLIDEACEDEVGLWLVIAMVRDDLLIHKPEEVRAVTLDIIQRMLESGRTQAGFYHPDGSGTVRWQGSNSEILSRIDEDWTHLGREPNIGEVVVLVANAPGGSPD